MLSTNGSTILQLDLDESDLAAFPKVKELYKERKGPLKVVGPLFTNLGAETRLRVKLRYEARNRKLVREAKDLPLFDDIETFKALLLSNASATRVDDLDMIFYDGYKVAMRSAPLAIQSFLSAKLFFDLQLAYDWDHYGRVPINSIISYLLKKREKTKFLITLHWYDSSYQGYLTEEDLKEYLVEQILPRIPSLAEVINSPMQDHYLCIATRKFFFMLDQKNLKKLRVVDIAASGLLEEMLNVADHNREKSISSNSDESSFHWFSKENCENIQTLYLELDSDGSGLLRYEELKNFRQITDSFVKRLFEMVQTYDRDQIDLRGFCDLLLAMENKSDASALNFYFRLLDVDGDGYLNAADLSFFYRDIAQLYEKIYSTGEPVPPFEDVKDEIFDMCRPSDLTKISLRELIESGKGGTIVGMLTDLNSFLAYECREDVVADE